MQSFEEWKEMKLRDTLKEQSVISPGSSGSSSSSSSQSNQAGQSKSSKHDPNVLDNGHEASSASKTGVENDEKVLIVPRRKNYASLDCGAKLIANNPDANNPSHILTESKDEYMLNSCSSKAWFVIELCESIKINEIELANLELFSNVPRLFRVYTSERYIQTTNGKNWPSKYLLGTFEASNAR